MLMRFFTYTITTLIFIFSVIGLPIAHAQIPVNDFAQLESDSDNPKSFQTVNVTAKSFSTDLNKATIAWYVNKKLVSSGPGLTTFSFKTGGSGSATVVDAKIKTFEGLTITKSLTFKPADVDLVWESDGIVPPFYKGKPLFVHQGDLNIVAIPNFLDKKGNRIDPSNLIYTWKQDYKVLGNSSGYGKQRLQLKDGVLIKDNVIGVVVTAASDSTLHGEASINLSANEPEILFYEDNPLYGILYNKAVPPHFKLRTSEIKLASVPYFFSADRQGSLQYTWSINNLEREDLKDTTSITLRPQNDTEGSSIIGLQISNLKEIFQTANTSVTLDFTKQNSSTQ